LSSAALRVENNILIAATLAAALLAGCSHAPERSAAQVEYAPGARAALGDSESVRKKLYAQYGRWKGAKYRIGGLSRDGIDCSGFVQVTFRTQLGIVLPRSTELQAELGKGVGRSELRPGDLVFFKTGWFERHVGMYLGRGAFLHASTSKGVTVSSLDEDYWKSAYWKSRRLT